MSRETEIKKTLETKVLRDLVTNIGINEIIEQVMSDENLALIQDKTSLLKIDLQLRNLIIQSKKLVNSAKA